MVSRDEQRKDDHRHCINIEIERHFDRKYNFSVQIKKSEHALGLCSDMKPFVRGQVDGHIGLEGSQLENIVIANIPDRWLRKLGKPMRLH